MAAQRRRHSAEFAAGVALGADQETESDEQGHPMGQSPPQLICVRPNESKGAPPGLRWSRVIRSRWR